MARINPVFKCNFLKYSDESVWKLMETKGGAKIEDVVTERMQRNS